MSPRVALTQVTAALMLRGAAQELGAAVPRLRGAAQELGAAVLRLSGVVPVLGAAVLTLRAGSPRAGASIFAEGSAPRYWPAEQTFLSSRGAKRRGISVVTSAIGVAIAPTPARSLSRIIAASLCIAVSACATQTSTDDPAPATSDATPLRIVDCLLPGQVRRLGTFSTGVSPRRPAKISQSECESAGGEYALSDANPTAALKIWLPFAQEGDAEAQTQVGELYEKGLGALADYATAAAWYQRAVDQGSARAMIDLASLYERGAGVPRDPVRAATLLRRASGLATGGAAPKVLIVEPSIVLPLDARAGAPSRVPLALPPAPLVLTGRVTADAGVRKVSVNGSTVTLDALGMFRAPVDLSGGEAQVVIEAAGANGKTSRVAFTLAATGRTRGAPVSTPSADASGGTYHALLIANQNYRHFERLDTPQRDAADLRRVLEQRFGFKVRQLNDASRGAILAALNQLRTQLGPRDNLLVFYAGHGEIDPVTKRGYWIPTDARPDSKANWISVVDVTDQLSAMAARQVLVVADSCYSGTMTRAALPQADLDAAPGSRQAAIDAFARSRARVALTSGGLEPVTDGGAGANSLFARTLLDVLGAVRDPIEAQRLHDELEARFLLRATKLRVTQRPDYGPIRFAGHEGGDFLFVPRS